MSNWRWRLCQFCIFNPSQDFIKMTLVQNSTGLCAKVVRRSRQGIGLTFLCVPTFCKFSFPFLDSQYIAPKGNTQHCGRLCQSFVLKLWNLYFSWLDMAGKSHLIFIKTFILFTIFDGWILAISKKIYSNLKETITEYIWTVFNKISQSDTMASSAF